MSRFRTSRDLLIYCEGFNIMDVISCIISLVRIVQDCIDENKEIDQDKKKDERFIDSAVMVKGVKYFLEDGWHFIQP